MAVKMMPKKDTFTPRGTVPKIPRNSRTSHRKRSFPSITSMLITCSVVALHLNVFVKNDCSFVGLFQFVNNYSRPITPMLNRPSTSPGNLTATTKVIQEGLLEMLIYIKILF